MLALKEMFGVPTGNLDVVTRFNDLASAASEAALLAPRCSYTNFWLKFLTSFFAALLAMYHDSEIVIFRLK